MIFDEQIARKPNRYLFTSQFIRAMHAGHWTTNEFSFTSDVQNYKTDLTTEEREVVCRTLSAIGHVECAVKLFWAKLGTHLPHPYMYDLGFVMANVEVIHSEAYERLLDVLQLQDVFQGHLQAPVIKNRVAYLRKYNERSYADSRKQFVYALILFTLFVENVSLFSQFYIILWFNRFRNVLKDTAQQVDYTKREELLHAQIGIKLIQTIRDEYPELFDAEIETKIIHEAKEAFKAESKIVDWMLGVYERDHLDSAILKEYIKGRINESLVTIGFAAPFELDDKLIEQSRWMEEDVLANSATDFFNKRPVEYTKNHASFDEEALFG